MDKERKKRVAVELVSVVVVWLTFHLITCWAFVVEKNGKGDPLVVTRKTCCQVPRIGMEREFAGLLLCCFPESTITHEPEFIGPGLSKEQMLAQFGFGQTKTPPDFKIEFPDESVIYLEVGHNPNSPRKKKQGAVVQEADMPAGYSYVQLFSTHYHRLKDKGLPPEQRRALFRKMLGLG